MSRVLVIGSENEVSQAIADALSAADFPMEYSVGHADALQRLRSRSFGIVVTSPASTVEEDLALLEEMRAVRPGVKCIVLARHSTPEEVIAALRARVFACFTPPFDAAEITNLARKAASDSQWRDDIQVLSAKPGWVSFRASCRGHRRPHWTSNGILPSRSWSRFPPRIADPCGYCKSGGRSSGPHRT